MKSWTIQELADFETHLSAEKISNTSFRDFTHTIQKLIDIPHSNSPSTPLHSNTKRGLTPKKVHEVEKIIGLLGASEPTGNIIDIGGGKGHLSAAICYHQSCTSISIDLDEQLQAQGRKRLQKWMPDVLSKIHFIPKKIGRNHPIPPTSKPNDTTLIGLHSCGNLSSQVIQQGIQQGLGKILNFGCCYHHINGDYNLSKVSQKEPIWFSHEALHLAAHAHRDIDKKALEKKIAVKQYRYTLHFYLKDQQKAEFQKVGDGHWDDYQGSFAAYAKKFGSTSLQSITDEALNEYFATPENQRQLQATILGGIIRNTLGRVIELYIVLDRCLLLQEAGYEVSLGTYFNRKISPRNLGIFAWKN